MTRVLIPPITQPPIAADGPLIRLHGVSMGTTWSVRAYGTDAAVVEHAIKICLTQVIADMSTWEADAFISGFNTAPAASWHDAPDDFLTVLTEALRIAALSDGAFDPACGALVDLWGFGPGGVASSLPTPRALARARAEGDWRRLALDGTRVLQPGGIRLDFSGIAKGFAVDKVAQALTRLGIGAYLVEIGGELKGQGMKPDGTPWFVGFETPPAAGAPEELVIALHAMAIASSGDYHRVRVQGGRRIAHTIDPRTGLPLGDDAPAGVSVVHRSCMTADGFATALGVLGLVDGMAFAAQHQLAARFLMREGDAFIEHLSPALAAMLD
ncbi:FAD:protein FMN transferase [Alphaproteobacteria bacterium SO-S41]|nr:FAD:protein FMN transferase [Alphaproteobacteria bacterium SO-S41]